MVADPGLENAMSFIYNPAYRAMSNLIIFYEGFQFLPKRASFISYIGKRPFLVGKTGTVFVNF